MGTSSEDEEEESEGDDEDDEWNRAAISSIPLVQHADLLARAAKNTWVNYRHPHIVYLLQNINLQTATPPIKQIIKRLQRTGATVCCADDPESHKLCLSPPPTIQETLQKLKTRDLYYQVSKSLNIDCTACIHYRTFTT